MTQVDLPEARDACPTTAQKRLAEGGRCSSMCARRTRLPPAALRAAR
ncbi:hypothetical protein [Rhodobacter capsulatus]